MGEIDSPGDTEKQSKRAMFKGALSRTKSKFKKDSKPKNEAYSEEVDDFLSAGRTSISSRTSTGDKLPEDHAHPTGATGPPRPSTSDSAASASSPRSPRKIPIPKIDVSNSQRWPRAQPVATAGDEINDFLRPQYQARSRSASSFASKAKRRTKNRNLSVSFLEAPPVVIGEGGDEAPAPTVEISRAKQRARSASPMPTRGQNRYQSNGEDVQASSPVFHHATHAPPAVLQPRMPLQRTPTGAFGTTLAKGGSALDKEFEMTLGGGVNMTTSPDSATASSPEIVAPKPMRVVKPPTALDEPRDVKKGSPSTDLRGQFREGDALRMHLDEDQSQNSIEEGRGRHAGRDPYPQEKVPSNWI